MSSSQAKLFNEVAISANTSVKLNVNSLKPSSEHISNRIQDISRTLNEIFPESQTETKLERARAILGEICIELEDDELISRLAQFQSLIESWLDSYEKKIFSGNTLEQLLRGKNECIE